MNFKLPKKYFSENKKFKKYNGKYKLSYSQYNSFKTDLYKPDYLLQYFLGEKQDDNIFALYGGQAGSYIGNFAQKLPLKQEEFYMLSDDDIKFLESLDYPKKATYEEEIVIDLGDFVVQGFIDRCEYLTKKSVGVLDFKTGNLDKKVDDYASQDYGQTTLYCLAKELEGCEIKYSQVMLLGRKGNGRQGHPLRLSGDKILIDTPYSKDRADKLIKSFQETAQEISFYYNTFLKLQNQ